MSDADSFKLVLPGGDPGAPAADAASAVYAHLDSIEREVAAFKPTLKPGLRGAKLEADLAEQAKANRAAVIEKTAPAREKLLAHLDEQAAALEASARLYPSPRVMVELEAAAPKHQDDYDRFSARLAGAFPATIKSFVEYERQNPNVALKAVLARAIDALPRETREAAGLDARQLAQTWYGARWRIIAKAAAVATYARAAVALRVREALEGQPISPTERTTLGLLQKDAAADPIVPGDAQPAGKRTSVEKIVAGLSARQAAAAAGRP